RRHRLLRLLGDLLPVRLRHSRAPGGVRGRGGVVDHRGRRHDRPVASELLGVHRAGVEAMTAPAPRPLRLAVTLMLVAAVASLGQAVLARVMADRIRSLALLGAVRNSVTGPFLAASAAEFTIVAAVVTGLAGAGLWAWLAVSAGRRRTWVRVAATVLAGLTVLVLVA